MGILTIFNGLDVKQENRYIRFSCETCLAETLEGHDWLRPTYSSPLATPINHDKKYMKELEDAVGPIDDTARAIMEKEMKFSYRQAMREIIFVSIICCPDILYAIT